MLSLARPSSWCTTWLASRCRPALLLVTMACAAPASANTLPISCEQALKSQPISLIVPNKAGGGYDTYGRAIAKELGNLIGTRIRVSNVFGGGGLMAMSQVSSQTEDEILLLVDGVEEVVNSTDGSGDMTFGSDAFAILGIIYTEAEAWIAPPGMDLSDQALSDLVFSTSSISSNFVPLVIASEALGFSIEVIGGYGGSGEAIAAVLRGETDLTTASVSSALRAADNNDLELVMVISDRPDARAANVRPFLGTNSVFEARSVLWTDTERTERQALAEMVLALGTTRRALFTASKVAPDKLACLQAATDLALTSDVLTESLARQSRAVEPVLSSDAQVIFERVRTAFADHIDTINKMRTESGL